MTSFKQIATLKRQAKLLGDAVYQCVDGDEYVRQMERLEEVERELAARDTGEQE